MPTPEIIVEVRNCSFSYETGNVLKDINCKIFANDLISVVGPNGGGKTTFLKMLLGILKPDSGEINFANGVTSEKIGYIPQYAVFDSKFPITAYEIVLGGTLSSKLGFYSRRQKTAAKDSLEKVGMQDFANRPVSALSGGQRQRIYLARAIAGGADMLLLDEPSANIDKESAIVLNNLLKELNRNMAIVLVTHDYSFVSDITKRVFCINRVLSEHPIEKPEEKIHGKENIHIVNHGINLDCCKGDHS